MKTKVRCKSNKRGKNEPHYWERKARWCDCGLMRRVIFEFDERSLVRIERGAIVCRLVKSVESIDLTVNIGPEEDVTVTATTGAPKPYRK